MGLSLYTGGSKHYCEICRGYPYSNIHNSIVISQVTAKTKIEGVLRILFSFLRENNTYYNEKTLVFRIYFKEEFNYGKDRKEG